MLTDQDAIIVIAASKGGLDPLRQLVSCLPEACGGAIFVVMHIGPHPSLLPSILSGSGPLHAGFAGDGEPIAAGRIYVAPPDRHMLLGPQRIRLSDGPKVNHTRPAADPLFVSAAQAFGTRCVGIVLSGGDRDGAVGLGQIKARGGLAFVQRPATAHVPSMPLASIAVDSPSEMSVDELARRLRTICTVA